MKWSRKEGDDRNVIDVRGAGRRRGGQAPGGNSGMFGSGGFQMPGDLDEAINASQAVGDDRLQGRNAGSETFTHGTSAQRSHWFKTGFDSGDPSSCGTFSGSI